MTGSGLRAWIIYLPSLVSLLSTWASSSFPDPLSANLTLPSEYPALLPEPRALGGTHAAQSVERLPTPRALRSTQSAVRLPESRGQSIVHLPESRGHVGTSNAQSVVLLFQVDRHDQWELFSSCLGSVVGAVERWAETAQSPRMELATVSVTFAKEAARAPHALEGVAAEIRAQVPNNTAVEWEVASDHGGGASALFGRLVQSGGRPQDRDLVLIARALEHDEDADLSIQSLCGSVPQVLSILSSFASSEGGPELIAPVGSVAQPASATRSLSPQLARARCNGTYKCSKTFSDAIMSPLHSLCSPWAKMAIGSFGAEIPGQKYALTRANALGVLSGGMLWMRSRVALTEALRECAKSMPLEQAVSVLEIWLPSVLHAAGGRVDALPQAPKALRLTLEPLNVTAEVMHAISATGATVAPKDAAAQAQRTVAKSVVAKTARLSTDRTTSRNSTLTRMGTWMFRRAFWRQVRSETVEQMQRRFESGNVSQDAVDLCSSLWTRGEMGPGLSINDGGHSGLPQNQNTLMVHVGKCCGSSLETVMRRDSVKFEQIHVRKVSEDELLGSSRVIITLRDPIDRLRSAFYHAQHDNSDVLAPCSSFEEFATNIGNTSSKCFQAVSAAMFDVHDTHVRFGFCWYMGGLIDSLRELAEELDNVRVTWQESCMEDYGHLRPWLGIQGKGWSAPNLRQQSYTPSGADLSEEQRRRLTMYLQHEYWLLGELKRLRHARQGMAHLE